MTNVSRMRKPVRRVRLLLGTLGLGVVLQGCVSVDPAADYARVQEEVSKATGFGPEWADPQRGEPSVFAGEDLLTMDQAVEQCLTNNLVLKAALFDIGMGRADAVQAGVLANPSLGAVVRLALGSSSSNSEFGLVEDLFGIIHRGRRKQKALHKLEATVFGVAMIAADLVADTKREFLRVESADKGLEVALANLETITELHDLTLERSQAGAATQVEVNVVRSARVMQELAIREARFESIQSRNRLARLLGLEGSAQRIRIAGTGRIFPVLLRDVDPERLLQIARNSRLDVRAAQERVELKLAALELEKHYWLRNGALGVSLESQGGEASLGPALELELPLFDQNQAGIAKANYAAEQAKLRLAGLRLGVEREVLSALETLQLASDVASMYRSQVLPLQESSFELARESFQEGKTGFLTVLEAQRALLGARRDLIEVQRAEAEALVELERACGRPAGRWLGSKPGASGAK